jgi:adenosylmethionine-8-amino-7-oxononanoate aminotransferase
MMKRSFFITATDTGVGKTMTTLILATRLRAAGHDVGVFKPVQSGGNDAALLRDGLGLEDRLDEINPFFAPEPLSPHLAFARAKVRIQPAGIMAAFERLAARHEIMLIEGAGGLLTPLTFRYAMADLVRDLGAALIIVARPGLGTINHTVLTVNEARRRGIAVAGVIFCDTTGDAKGLAAMTNPAAIRRIAGVPLLGAVPFVGRRGKTAILRAGAGVDVPALLRSPRRWSGRQLMAIDKKYVWHPFTAMQDWLADVPGQGLVIDRGEGSYLVDVDGCRYLDGVSSLWVNVHGHRKRELDEALVQQAGKIAHSTFLGLTHPAAVELARELVGIAPKGLAKVFYSDNGSTAVEIALKMSYQYWQNTGRKTKRSIIHLANAYHGDTLGSVSVGGIDLFHRVYRGLMFRSLRLDMPVDGYAPTFEAADRLEALLKKKHASIASLVLEPVVQGAAGMIMWPKGLLKRFATLCRKYDVLLIADEVATGFGRTGTMFACDSENVRPDILCMAKGITGGYLPLAATLTTQRVFDGFVFPYKDMKTFFHGHTYTGNPLACAVALANIRLFRTEKVLERLQPRIAYLARRLMPLRDMPCVGDIRQRGFMVGIELVMDRATGRPFPWQDRAGARVCAEARHHGVIIRPLGNVIVLMPPLSMTIPELDALVCAVERAIQVVFPVVPAKGIASCRG